MDSSGIKFVKKVYLTSHSADPSPPLGTVLGNIGANATTFCTQFNSRTSELPTYFSLKTTIFIYENKSMNFIVDLPSISSFLNLLKFDSIVKVRIGDRYQDKQISCVKLYYVLQLAKLKFPNKPLSLAFRIVMGTIYSMGLTVNR